MSEPPDTPFTLLLVPPEGDPDSLFLYGVCGSSPPTVWRERLGRDTFEYRSPTDDDWCEPTGNWCYFAGEWGPTGYPEALVLVWRDQVVESGCDTLWRCAGAHTEGFLEEADARLFGWSVPAALALARAYVGVRGGQLVTLDCSDGALDIGVC